MVGVLFFFTARDQAAIADTSERPQVLVNVVAKQWAWDRFLAVADGSDLRGGEDRGRDEIVLDERLGEPTAGRDGKALPVRRPVRELGVALIEAEVDLVITGTVRMA